MKDEWFYQTLDRFFTGSISRAQLRGDLEEMGYGPHTAEAMSKDIEAEAKASMPERGKS